MYKKKKMSIKLRRENNLRLNCIFIINIAWSIILSSKIVILIFIVQYVFMD